MSNEPKYNITVKMLGKDGNVFNVIGLATKALRKNKVPAAEITKFTEKCFNSANYDEVLRTVMEWMVVE